MKLLDGLFLFLLDEVSDESDCAYASQNAGYYMMAVYRKESRSANANHRDDESEPLSPAGVANGGFQCVIFPTNAVILLFFGHG